MRRSLTLITLVAVVIAGAFVAGRWRSSNDRDFVAADWRAGGTESTCGSKRRDQMADDLIEHHLQSGMTPAQVHHLLGEPYASKQYGAKRGEWWPVSFERNDCTVLSVWYRHGQLVDARK
jgi:hypothetical protein